MFIFKAVKKTISILIKYYLPHEIHFSFNLQFRIHLFLSLDTKH